MSEKIKDPDNGFVVEKLLIAKNTTIKISTSSSKVSTTLIFLFFIT